jgi:hypothetical protein
MRGGMGKTGEKNLKALRFFMAEPLNKESVRKRIALAF